MTAAELDGAGPGNASADSPVDPVAQSMLARQSNYMDQLGRQADERPDDVAMRFSGVSTTWSQLSDRVDQLADGLHGLGVRFGDPIAILMMNRTEFFEAVLAANKLGAVTIPVNFRLSPDQIVYLLKEAGSRFLFVDTPLLSLATAARERLGPSTALIVVGESSGSAGRALIGERPAGEPQPPAVFLGVPVRVLDEVFGSLHLSGHDDGEVSTADTELISSLAATAEVAIENARLFDEARRREDWMQASTEITRQLLSVDGEEPLRVIARRVQQIAEADSVNVILPARNGERLVVKVATGAGADGLEDKTYPIDDTLSQAVLQSGESLLIPDMAQEHDRTLYLSKIVPIGPLMALPLVGTQGIRGALMVGRLHGGTPFTEADMEMATTFANHAAVALELADTRADRQNVATLADRDRIARDLHDHVIQRLFGAGLTVESIASGMRSDPSADRLTQVVNDIDETIRQIRTSIFQLRGSLGPQTGAVRSGLLEVVNEISALLKFEPRVTFSGPVDAVIPDDVRDDLVAVLREALTNVARHAHAQRVSVNLTAARGRLVLEMTDDGVGIGRTERRSGLANLQRRAEQHGGSLAINSPHPHPERPDKEGGTNLRWSIPLS